MAEIKATNIHQHHGKVTREAREELNGHRGFTIWFTGLSGSGKSTVAVAVEEALYNMSCRTYILDGDNVRFGLNKNLGFTKEDRVENIRRIGEVAKLFRDSGIINLVAFISPFREERDMARALGGPGDFVEIFVDAPLEVCEQRDPKGLYKKARAGQIPEFTGISSPYEPPLKPEMHLHTDKHSVEEMTDLVLKYLREQKLIAAG